MVKELEVEGDWVLPCIEYSLSFEPEAMIFFKALKNGRKNASLECSDGGETRGGNGRRLLLQDPVCLIGRDVITEVTMCAHDKRGRARSHCVAVRGRKLHYVFERSPANVIAIV